MGHISPHKTESIKALKTCLEALCICLCRWSFRKVSKEQYLRQKHQQLKLNAKQVNGTNVVALRYLTVQS